jgi:NAD+ synthase (glutamine-hydrolysing)
MFAFVMPFLPHSCIVFRPVMFPDGRRYNCRLTLYNDKILCIRPKLTLADTGNYREPRWFSAWTQDILLNYELPHCIQDATQQVAKILCSLFF